MVRTRNFSPRGPNLPRKGEKEDPAHYEKNKKPINRVIAFVPRGREDDVLSSLQDTVVDHEAKWLGRDAARRGTGRAGDLPVPVYTPCTVMGFVQIYRIAFPLFVKSSLYMNNSQPLVSE